MVISQQQQHWQTLPAIFYLADFFFLWKDARNHILEQLETQIVFPFLLPGTGWLCPWSRASPARTGRARCLREQEGLSPQGMRPRLNLLGVSRIALQIRAQAGMAGSGPDENKEMSKKKKSHPTFKWGRAAQWPGQVTTHHEKMLSSLRLSVFQARFTGLVLGSKASTSYEKVSS